MFKTILVPAAGSSQTNVALETAAVLGEKFNAHIECLRIHLDPAHMLAIAASADMGSGFAAGQMLQTLQEDDERRTKAARLTFDAFRKRRDISLASEPGTRGLTATWREVTSNETDGVLSRAHFNDLVILEHPSGGGGFAPIPAGAVLLGSGRPVLVAGPQSLANFPRTIAVAWKETAEATRAIAAALPLLAMAERTVVISVNEDGSKEAEARASLGQAVEYLRWHGLSIEGRYAVAGLNGGAETVLAEAHKAGAEMLVMGGYGHSRLREFIFGGFTRSVLKGVSLPVLLSH
jgi:nucleotide-binding universal stress UspA family protein